MIKQSLLASTLERNLTPLFKHQDYHLILLYSDQLRQKKSKIHWTTIFFFSLSFSLAPIGRSSARDAACLLKKNRKKRAEEKSGAREFAVST